MLTEAQSALASDDLRRAAALLGKVLSAEPRNSAAHTLAGITADRQNNSTLAVRHFAAAAKLAPDAPETRNNYGAILLKLNKKTEAAREFAASLKANPNQPSALVNLAQIRFAENDLSAARQLFEKAEASQPDAEIARALVIIAIRLNETEAAKTAFREYAELAKNVPLSAASRAELGAALLESNLIAEAVQELETAASLDSSNFKTAILLSRAYTAKKDIKAAGRLLEKIVAGGVEDAEIYAALADVYEAGGFTENAIPAMRLAIAREPKNEFYRYRYGMLLTDSKVPAAAVIRLEEAVREFPDSARIWLALGIARLNDNQTIEAQSAFLKSLTLDSRLVPALAYLGTAYTERGDNAEAVRLYERALKIEEKNALLHYLLADALSKIPNSDQAQIERNLKRAVEIDDKLASAHLALGRLLAQQGRWSDALLPLERAEKIEPERAETLYQLGRVYTRLKRMNESKATLEKFKKLNDAQKEQKEVDRRALVRRLANVRF